MFVRRIATVTICAPDATTAARVSVEILVLAGADEQARAIGAAGDRSGSTTAATGYVGSVHCADFTPVSRAVRTNRQPSAAADGADDFERIALARPSSRHSGCAARSRRFARRRCAFREGELVHEIGHGTDRPLERAQGAVDAELHDREAPETIAATLLPVPLHRAAQELDLFLEPRAGSADRKVEAQHELLPSPTAGRPPAGTRDATRPCSG